MLSPTNLVIYKIELQLGEDTYVYIGKATNYDTNPNPRIPEYRRIHQKAFSHLGRVKQPTNSRFYNLLRTLLNTGMTSKEFAQCFTVIDYASSLEELANKEVYWIAQQSYVAGDRLLNERLLSEVGGV